jgi:hypothetical protein
MTKPFSHVKGSLQITYYMTEEARQGGPHILHDMTPTPKTLDHIMSDLVGKLYKDLG